MNKTQYLYDIVDKTTETPLMTGIPIRSDARVEKKALKDVGYNAVIKQRMFKLVSEKEIR